VLKKILNIIRKNGTNHIFMLDGVYLDGVYKSPSLIMTMGFFPKGVLY